MAGTQTCNTSKPPNASKDVSRRSVLSGATLVAGGAAVVAAGLTTQRAEAKMTEQAAGYVPVSKTEQQCGNCSLFIEPSSCRLVDGTISPKGYCKFYVKKS